MYKHKIAIKGNGEIVVYFINIKDIILVMIYDNEILKDN